MPIDVKCPKCTKQYRLRDELNGKKFKCKDCGIIVTATPLKSGSPRSGEERPTSGASSPKTKPPSLPADGARPTAKRRPSRGSASRPAAGSSPPKQKKPKHNPFGDDYRDAKPDDLFGEPFDDFGDDYGDESDAYGDDAFGSGTPKRKSTTKKKGAKGSGSGIKLGFHANGLNVALLIGGIAMFVFGVNETRLAAKSKQTANNVSLADLVANGIGDNIHLTISGVEPLDGQFVYEARNRAATSYTKVFIPCIPANSNARTVGCAQGIRYFM